MLDRCKLGLVTLAAFLIIGTPARVQAEGGKKVGYLDLSRVFNKYNKTEQLTKELELKKNAKETQREGIVAELKKLRDELALSSSEAKEKKQQQIEEKERELEDFDREARIDLRREENVMVRNILQEIQKVVEEYGEKEGYSVILNDRVLLYGDKSIDLTEEIIGILNKRYKKAKAK